jgi:hypothetical protein
MSGPYIYPRAEKLAGKDMVGSHECVVLIQTFAAVPLAATWTAGDKVAGNTLIHPGTAIATFWDGKYPNQKRGNHAAFYLSQDAKGIWVIDQWKGRRSGKIERTLITFKAWCPQSLTRDPELYRVIL